MKLCLRFQIIFHITEFIRYTASAGMVILHERYTNANKRSLCKQKKLEIEKKI